MADQLRALILAIEAGLSRQPSREVVRGLALLNAALDEFERAGMPGPVSRGDAGGNRSDDEQAEID